LSCQFWPFTEVLRKIFGSLTREVWLRRVKSLKRRSGETADGADVTNKVSNRRQWQRMDLDSTDKALLRSMSLATVGARIRQYSGARASPQTEKTISRHTVKRDG
jgi:hypothetical protein